MSAEILVADKHGRVLQDFYNPARVDSTFTKKDAPILGEAFGDWMGEQQRYYRLPGGAMMMFDLSRLTLNDYRNMRDNYQINVSLTVLMFMLHQLDWHIECQDQRIANQIEENLQDIWTQLIRGVSQAHWAGYSPMVLQYENNPVSGFVEITKIKDLPPDECKPHFKEVDGYAPPGKTPPKMRVFDGIDQFGRSFPIPPDNSMWYPLFMENGNLYGRKLLRPAFPSWYFSILMHLFSNRYFERFGEPLPIGRADFDASVTAGNGKVISGKDAMEIILMNLRNRSVAVLPSDRDPITKEYDFDIEYLESQMRGADFERYMSRLDEEMSLALFTPTLLFRTADVGSYNLGISHMQMFQWSMNMHAGDVGKVIEDTIVKRLHDFNFSPRAPKAFFRWRSMGKDNTALLQTIVEFTLRRGDAQPDLVELGKAVGMTFNEITQIIPLPAGTADPNNPGEPINIKLTSDPKQIADAVPAAGGGQDKPDPSQKATTPA